MIYVKEKNKIFIYAWVGYALFYLCRANMSIAIPLIAQDLNITNTELGVPYSQHTLLDSLLTGSLETTLVPG